MSSRVLAATLLSLATAFFYALSNLLQMMEAEKVPEEYALRAGLLARLVKRPRWWLGFFSDVFGFLTQAAALALAAVVFVEPILATGILMALFLGALVTHRPVHRSAWVAAIILSLGLALFLYEVSPTGGTDVGDVHRWLLAGPIVTLAIVLCMLFGSATHGGQRAAYLGVAAGMAFGVSAVLTKTLMHYLGDGIFAWVTHWEPYALAVFAIGGVIIAQSALQTGALGAAVSGQEAMAPITAAALGLALLHENINATTFFEVVAVLLSVGAVLWGIITLASAEEQMLLEIGHEGATEEAQEPVPGPLGT